MMDTKDAKRSSRIKALRGAALNAAPVRKSSGDGPLAFLRPYRGVFIALAIFLLGSTIVNRMSVSDNGYRLNEHLDECAFSITSPYGQSSELTMADLSRYIMRIEREGDIHAKAYDANDTSAYWKLRISTDQEAAYISTMGKKTVMDYALRDEIYAMEAQHAGFAPDEDAFKDLHYEAEREYLKMSEREKLSTGLTVEAIEENMKKETLVHEYMVYLNDVAGEGTDVGGAYYEGLKQTYEVSEHTDVTEPLRIGYVTIN